MGEEDWPKDVVRSKEVVQMKKTGRTDEMDIIITEGPRPIICADCGEPVVDGVVFHLKPSIYAFEYLGERFYLERHIGIACGCAAKRGLVP